MPNQELKSIDDYEAFLTETMTPWSPQQRVALAAAIAEHWLPAYESFSAEEEWGDPASLRRSLANLAAGTVTNLAKLAKTRLKKMQYTHDLVDGFFKATGLSPP